MAKRGSKYRIIFETMRREIRSGRYPGGVALPSEEQLVRRFGVSRITAVKAMDELVKEGLVYRKRGVGTFATREACSEAGQLGLIVPGLSYGEIFPLITQDIMRLAQRDGFTLPLGDISAREPVVRAREACRVARRFVEQQVAGVIFQPLAFLKTPDRISREILAMFKDADIPVVILDRDITSDVPHDFVGIDNLAAGRAVGAHMLERRAKRIHFLMRPNCASVIRDRLDGVRSAIAGRLPKDHLIVSDPDDARTLAKWFRRGRSRPDAVICESDYIAARFMATLSKFRLEVPRDVLVSGFDDVRYAEITNPQLTTIHQPCSDIAAMVYRALRERMRDNSIPSRKILLPAPLVVRGSSMRQ